MRFPTFYYLSTRRMAPWLRCDLWIGRDAPHGVAIAFVNQSIQAGWRAWVWQLHAIFVCYLSHA